MRALLFAAALIATPAAAQSIAGGTIDPTPIVSAQAKADAALAAAAAAQQAAQQACQPMSAVPPSETVGGSGGTGTACRLVNAVQPRITRTASCAFTISVGVATCTTNWDGGPFPSGTTIRLTGSPAIVDTGPGSANEQPITCKAYGVSVTGISFRCWQAQSSVVSLLGATVLPFSAPAQTATVQATAIPSS